MREYSFINSLIAETIEQRSWSCTLEANKPFSGVCSVHSGSAATFVCSIFGQAGRTRDSPTRGKTVGHKFSGLLFGASPDTAFSRSDSTGVRCILSRHHPYIATPGLLLFYSLLHCVHSLLTSTCSKRLSVLIVYNETFLLISWLGQDKPFSFITSRSGNACKYCESSPSYNIIEMQ